MSITTLETLRSMIGINPWHFWGFYHPEKAPRAGSCDDIFYDEPWQGNSSIGRNEMRRWLDVAEEMLHEKLGYSIGPNFHSLERHEWPQYQELSVAPYLRGRHLTTTTKRVKIMAIGAKSQVLVDTPAVSFVDRDGDGLPDEFLITVVLPTGADKSELKVYIPASERLYGEGPIERWQIAPVYSVVTGSSVAIRGPAYLLGKPAFTAYTYTGRSADPTDTNSFCTTLDVYRETTNTDDQATLWWSGYPSGCACWIGGDPAGLHYATARVAIVDPAAGIIAPVAATLGSDGNWSTNHIWSCIRPDFIRVNYVEGLPLDDKGQPQIYWQTVVAKLAVSLMPDQICACEAVRKQLYKWNMDVARTDSNQGEVYAQISQEDLNNPFGTKRGQVDAWKAVRDLQFIGGTTLL